jgi:hypothetical protein
MKKILLWMFVFSTLTAYSWNLLAHYDESSIAEAHASFRYSTVEERKQSAFERVVERLTIRRDDALEQCDTASDHKSVAQCVRSSIFSRLILLFSAHVS